MFDRDNPLDAEVTAVLGPTNTGKTHYAVERMLARESGVMGFPLRLLAREVYDRIVALRGPGAAALVTGEEKIAPPTARYWCCTVESMPVDQGFAFLAIDEIQLCADADRGHVFTDRLLRARGTQETLLLGAATMRGRIANLIPRARFLSRPRLSTLSYVGGRKLSRLPPRAAVVAFSVDQVYAMAELMRRQKGGVAVVMGALSPRTRNAQVALFQSGDVQHLVATDAIGMGLNLDLSHVFFGGLAKFDGRRHRDLTPQEIGQIAGRAGRHLNDGGFGVTGEAGGLDPDLVEQIQNHDYESVRKLQWRNSDLTFGTIAALIASLEAPPPHRDLLRAREADDLAALRALAEDPDIRDRAEGGRMVRRLWEVCQLPDFRKTGPREHAELLSRLFEFLSTSPGVIPEDWLAGQMKRLDRTEGDIDALSKRLAYVRSWAYVANRADWLRDPATWRGQTRELENRLSDALHDRLTQRFVDRRNSVLMRRLKQKERLVAEVSDAGDVTVEGHHLGKLEGFRFRPDPDAEGDEKRTLRAASREALQAHFARRAEKFYNAPDTEIDATDQGGLMWGEVAVGRLEKGADPLSPTLRAFVDDDIDPAVAEKVARRLTHWIERRIAALFEPLIALRDDPAMTGLARGVGFQLVEALGVIPRRQIADDVKALDQEARGLLRKHGVRFGQHHVFLPALLKPAPTRMRILLWSIAEGFEEYPEAPPPGLVTVPVDQSAPQGFYTRAGYRPCGARALRIDMLERLADMIRPLDARAGFEATGDMLSITGCTLEQFADLMQGLGYAAEKGERAKPEKSAEAAPAASATDTPTPEATNPEAGSPVAPAEGAAPEGDSAEANPAEADTPAEAAAETPVEPETQSAETAAAEAEPPAQAASAQADAPEADQTETPADPADAPPETETFFTFTYAPRPRRERGDRPRRREDRGGETQGQGKPRGERPQRDGKPRDGKPGEKRGPRADGKPGREDKQGRGGKPGKGGKPAGPRVHAAGPPRREKKADPDSPFAVLQQLKDKL